MNQRDSERIFNKAIGHDQAVRELEAEAAAAGRRLTGEEQEYVAELKKEGSAILETSNRASQQETGERLGRVVTADINGNLLTEQDKEEAKESSKPGTTAGRIAD